MYQENRNRQCQRNKDNRKERKNCRNKNGRRRNNRKRRNIRIGIRVVIAVLLLFIAVRTIKDSHLFSQVPKLIAENALPEMDKDTKESSQKQISAKDNGEDIQIVATNACVMNADTGTVLYEKNSNDEIAPASTTKLVTALTAMKYCDMEDTVTIGKEVGMIASDSSRAWLRPGEKMSVRQLMIAMLLPSGNDAAYALAAYTGRIIAKDKSMDYQKAVDVFVKQMNKTAQEVSANNSKFQSPDGYDCNGQAVTAHDMAEVGKAVVASSEITSITCLKESHEKWKTGETGDYVNTNELLNTDSAYYNRDTIGLKTGTSDKAGCCLVSAFEINKEDYIVVVMGSTEEGRWEDTQKLYQKIKNGEWG